MPSVMVLLGIIALAIWTGYGMLRGLVRQLRLEIAEGVFIFGLSGVLLLGWLALVAAEFGFFSAALVAIAGVLIGLVGVMVGRWRGTALTLTASASRWQYVFLAVLTAVMTMLYFRPHEFIWGGADAGVYVNEGAQLSRSGRWLISQPDFADLATADYGMFFREQPPNLVPRFYYLPGFYVDDGQAASLTPQFYPLHPVWLAIAHGLGGLDANLLMTPLWGLLGVLSVYFAIREALDVRIAALAAMFLALTPLQIWFARYPTAEVLTQFLTFGGLFAFARYLRRGETWAGLLTGFALGEVMLVRPDTYFLLGVLIVYAGYLRLQRQFNRRYWLVAAPMLLMTSYSLFHVVWQGWPYFYDTYLAAPSLTLPLPILALGAIIAAVAFVWFDRQVAGQPDWQAHWRPIGRKLLTLAAVGVVGLAVYAYFISPLRADPNRLANYWYSGSTIPDVEPFNFVRLGWYLSPLGLAVAVVGLALLVKERWSPITWPLLGVGLFFTLLYVYRTYNNPHQIYVMRRYVPQVVPTLALGMAYPILWLGSWRPIGRVLAGGLTIVLIGLLLYSGRAVIPQIDFQGSTAQYRAFAQSFPPHSIILFNDNAPVGVSALFGTPLAYLDQQTVIDIQEDRVDQAKLSEYVQHWLVQGRSVFVIDGPQRVSGFCDVWQCRSLGITRFKWSELEQTYEHFPETINHAEYPLDIYQVQAVVR